MIKNSKYLRKFEIEYIKKNKVNILQNFKLMDYMYNEAVELGVFPLENPLEGIEVDIKIAKVVNNV